MERAISVLGMFSMVGFAWLLSSNRWRISLRVVAGGMFLQFVFGILLLRTRPGQLFFEHLGDFFNALLACVDVGAKEVFGAGYEEHFIAFKILPTIIVFSSLMSVLYYFGLIQVLVRCAAWLMQKTLGISGAESLATAANIFVGQTEAPLVVRPYIVSMTTSELMSVMVGGFATIAGGVFAAYVGMGIPANHLMTASVISAPAALLIAKVLQPEVDEPKTLGKVSIEIDESATNVIEAAGNGAIAGLKLALNVGAMLITFIALVAIVNAGLAWFGNLLRFEETWTLERALGIVFLPFAWLMGIPAQDCRVAGELLGTKMVLNEFVAYQSLGKIVGAEVTIAEGNELSHQLSERSITILSYALCGFANFASIGIQLGGIGGIAPERKSELAQLGFRAMLGGTLAAFMTACVAGILIA